MQDPFEAKQQTTPISWVRVLVAAIPVLGVTCSSIMNPEEELKTALESTGVILLFAIILFSVIFLIVRKIKPPAAGTYLALSSKGIRYRRLKLIEWDKIWYLYIEKWRGKSAIK
ncbi:MAG: hypothetical protein J7599_09405 [Niabella sp.]|nr:hypothetical protein [Niabella sp.]